VFGIRISLPRAMEVLGALSNRAGDLASGFSGRLGTIPVYLASTYGT
jgi:hypothetical protein